MFGNMACKKRRVHVFSLLVVLLQLEVQVRSQSPQQHQQSDQLSFGAEEMFSPSSQNLMEEMFHRHGGVARTIGVEKTSPELVGNLIFQPSLLDFLERSIGDPHNQVVILINKHKSRSVYLGSISGSTPDFYSSYFKDIVIPPEGNTTFNVVFLPRQLGATAGSIEIHTSFGLLQYQVKGEGTECPYRLRPLVGLKAPLNATLTPEITLHNPHDTTLQIIEIYSSGGNFQLELPSGAQEGPQALWEIPPHSTRSVIRVRFHGKTAGNHTAYVRIKISGGSDEPTLIDKMLVVPIEIEIVKETGIYSKMPFVDLGTGATNENVTKLSLDLTNSGNRPVNIRSWGITTKYVESLYCFQLHILPFNAHLVMNVEIDWAKIIRLSDFQMISGEFAIHYVLEDDDSQEVRSYVIPFVGQVLKGSLKHNADALKFSSSSNNSEQLEVPRPLVIRNKYNVPLSISNITVPEDCSRNFRIEGFRPRIVQPDQEETLLHISRILSNSSNRSVATYIRLLTNVTQYDLPVYSYTGKLKRILPYSITITRPTVDYEQLDLDERELNFGILPISTIGETHVAFFNANPVEVPIRHWKGAITSGSSGAPTITVILRECGPYYNENIAFCHTLQPSHWIVFQVSVQSSTTDSYQGTFSITTDYEEIVTPISFTTAVGKLDLNRELLHFDNCFPGKLCSLNLTAHSTFLSKIHVEGIKTDVDGIEYAVENRHPVIHPNTVANIGRLVFDPKAYCKTDCYSSFDLLSKPFGVKWMATLDNYEQYRKLDSEKLQQQLRLYTEMKQSMKSIRFQLTTEPIRKFEFNATVDLVWPKLLTENIHFPTLQVDQEAVKLITINNPSDQILFVHLVLHDVNVQGKDVSAIPQEVLSKCANCSLSGENVFSFFLFDYDDIYVNYVKPQSFLKIAVKFTSKEPGTYSTIFYMRNNLTLIDAVWIQAKAVVPQFKFGNRKPGSPTALQFEITDKHLKMCSKLQEPDVEENEVYIQTKRSFTARNYGEVPITISGIRVEDILCEGYGFKILDCSPFELLPNASKKIEIAFSPDFTLARVTRTLNFDTNINTPVNFTLLGTVPAHGLEMCGLSLKRPWFEPMLRVVLICVLSVVFIGTLVTAFLDANNVINDHILNMSRDRGPIQPPLDLRQIALESQAAADDSAEKNTISLNNNSKTSHNHNNSKKKPSSKQQNAKIPNGNATSLNKSWNDFTTKLGSDSSSKPIESPTSKASPEPEKRSQKYRRSITPPKEETPVRTSTSNSSSSSSSSNNSIAKELSKASVEEDCSSTATDSSETSSTISSASISSSGSAVSSKTTPPLPLPLQQSASEIKSPKSATANQPQHENTLKKNAPSDLKLESNSTLNVNNFLENQSINNDHHQQRQQQQQQSKATLNQQQLQPCQEQFAKSNVKKTKSLPMQSKHGNVPSPIPPSTTGQPKDSYNINSSSNSSSSSSGGGSRNGSKNVGNEKSVKYSNKNSDKSREYLSKENGHLPNEQSGKNDSLQPRKYGKTLGRERKLNNQNKKGSNHKNSHKSQQAQFPPSNSSKSGIGGTNANTMSFFHSNNIPTSQITAPSSIWGENRARFSDVVAQATTEKSGNSHGTTLAVGPKPLKFDLNTNLDHVLGGTGFGSGAMNSIAASSQKNEAPKVAASLFGKAKDDCYVGLDKDLSVHVGSELGPIGTAKKSPLAAPKCWEPFGNLMHRPASTGGGDLSNPDSYFSQTFADFNHNGNEQFRAANNSFASTNNSGRMDNQNQLAFGGLNSAHGLKSCGDMDPVNQPMAMVDQCDWDSNQILWQMIQKSEELSSPSHIDWRSLWAIPSMFPNQTNPQHQQNIPTTSAMPMNSRLTNNWLNPGSSSRPPQMPLRAPPGFSPVKPNPNSALLAQAQMQQMTMVQQQLKQQQQQQQQPQPQPTQQNALHDLQDNVNGVNGSSSSVPAYDPFRLSSIWAPANTGNDAWNEKK
ncbi:transmembrane protein 131 homolog isoform X2 [Toxorhynchites rutilus septentrionalis]|uniref:transmembrane protein 131 homolog isoform X2 n=1 Tax=Toxorhynchites rutilus septentrionalis TaxID=329112 RepID=UPI002478A1FA|nr:transmembrane protein 131 homolog isoform X2 [Toxorhynchites rutilus septentrionalis]